MSPEKSNTECPREMLDLMRELEASLKRSCDAVCKANSSSLRSEITEQMRLCGSISLCRVKGHSCAALSDRELPRLSTKAGSGLKTDWRKALREIASSNRRYAALLMRARRTADIFCRLLQQPGITYPPPAHSRGALGTRN